MKTKTKIGPKEAGLIASRASKPTSGETRPAKTGRGRNRPLPKSSEATKAKRLNVAKPAETAKPKRDNGGRARGETLDLVVGLLRKEGGSTIAEIQNATGWLPHTTRAYLSKGGPAGKVVGVQSEKVERDGQKVRVYSAA